MSWLSALLVFGTTALILSAMSAEDGALPLARQQMIHARIPWLLLGMLWIGGALGVAAVVRRRSWAAIATLVLELPLVALASWYFLVFSYLPEHELVVGVADVFPSYALTDQDGVVRSMTKSTLREPALYIFYRGDW